MSLASKCNHAVLFLLFFLPDNGITVATHRSYSCIIGLGSCDIHIVYSCHELTRVCPYMAKSRRSLEVFQWILKDWHYYICFQHDDDCHLLLPRNFVWPWMTKRLLEHYNSSADSSIIPQLVLGTIMQDATRYTHAQSKPCARKAHRHGQWQEWGILLRHGQRCAVCRY